MATPTGSRWQLRDFIAATVLFTATAAFVLWQNSRLSVLWDASYLLDTAWRMALGQHPYRDFPLVHAPLTFLLQAAIMRLTGRVYLHHVLYAAVAGGLASVLTWRIALTIFRERAVERFSGTHNSGRHHDRSQEFPWLLSFLLATPLTVLGIYNIFPMPFYDCDCVLAVLVAVFALQRLPSSRSSPPLGLATGAALVLPLFFKQNIGLPFLLSALAAIVLMLSVHGLGREAAATPAPFTLLWVLAGAAITLLATALVLHLTAGVHSYIYWTIHFAAQRRLPGLHDMLLVFAEPALLWQLPCIAAAVLLLARIRTSWASWIAFALLATPFLWTLALLALHTDSSDRADDLLALWPLLLVLAANVALIAPILAMKRRTLTLGTLLPLLLLATVFGAMLSQQLWGSTYAIWPLLVLLVAGLIATLATLDGTRPRLLPALAAIFATTLLVCGGIYAGSAERLSYAQLHDGPLQRSTAAALRGMATRGPYLPAFDQLLRFAAAEIPRDDALLLLPGEDPFYFATGRTPRFPVLLFDSTCDPYSPAELAALAHEHNVRWLILERNLQLTADPTPQRDTTLQLLAPEFTLYRTLDNYDIYRRR